MSFFKFKENGPSTSYDGPSTSSYNSHASHSEPSTSKITILDHKIIQPANNGDGKYLDEYPIKKT